MLDPLGREFYEWWAGLRRWVRCSVALALIAVAGLLALWDPDGWMTSSLPLAMIGLILLLLSGNWRSLGEDDERD